METTLKRSEERQRKTWRLHRSEKGELGSHARARRMDSGDRGSLDVYCQR